METIVKFFARVIEASRTMQQWEHGSYQKSDNTKQHQSCNKNNRPQTPQGTVTNG